MIGKLVGNYKITEKIGEGGMGEVFRGTDIMLEREVAIKVLRPELARDPNIVERFRAEAVTLAKLNHPNIATLYSFLRQGDDFFMVMEYVRGETIDALIRRHGAMPVNRAVRLFSRGLKGIAHAHRSGIVHRDIKPANVMLTTDGTLKVMDFGIARVLGTTRTTRTGRIIGTLEYMSPEQIRGEEVGARSDIYSLGILLYEMLTGRIPFSATSEYDLMRAQIEEAPKPPTEFASHIPLPVERAIMRALAKKPEARFQNASEFRRALLKGIGAVVDPLDDSTFAQAIPPTRLATPQSVPASEQVAKEARLPGGVEARPAAEAQIKETRMGGQAANQSVYQQDEPQYDLSGSQAEQPRASLLSRLNLKHLAAGAVALFAIIFVPLVLLSGEEVTSEKQAPVRSRPQTSQPSGTQSPGAAQAPQQDTAPAQKEQGTTPQSPYSEMTPSAPLSGSSSESAEPNRPRGGRSPRPAPPPSSKPPSSEKEKTVKKEESESKGEKKGGGVIDKVKGGLGKLNPFGRGKKKEEKKP